MDTLLYCWVCASCGRSLGVVFYVSLEGSGTRTCCTALHRTVFAFVDLHLGVTSYIHLKDPWVRKVSAVCCYIDFCLGLSVCSQCRQYIRMQHDLCMCFVFARLHICLVWVGEIRKMRIDSATQSLWHLEQVEKLCPST